MEYFFDSDSFKKTNMYNEFIKENNSNGILKIEAYTARRAYPLQNVKIEVYKIINDSKVIFYDGFTNESGIIEAIVLPTKKASLSINNASDIVYTNYEVDADYPKYKLHKDFKVSIFDDLKVIQPVSFPVDDFIDGDINE